MHGQTDFRQLCNKFGEYGFVYDGNLGQYYTDEGNVIIANESLKVKTATLNEILKQHKEPLHIDYYVD